MGPRTAGARYSLICRVPNARLLGNKHRDWALHYVPSTAQMFLPMQPSKYASVIITVLSVGDQTTVRGTQITAHCALPRNGFSPFFPLQFINIACLSSCPATRKLSTLSPYCPTNPPFRLHIPPYFVNDEKLQCYRHLCIRSRCSLSPLC